MLALTNEKLKAAKEENDKLKAAKVEVEAENEKLKAVKVEAETIEKALVISKAENEKLKAENEKLKVENEKLKVEVQVQGTQAENITLETSTVAPANKNEINFDLAGSVYVQEGAELGVASYHFDSLTKCYISYKNAPKDWILDDGKKPPEKKYFTRTSYNDETRTFMGVISWVPSLWDTDNEWDYEFIFSEKFDTIVSGTCTCRPSGIIDKYGWPFTAGNPSNDALMRYKLFTPATPMVSEAKEEEQVEEESKKEQVE